MISSSIRSESPLDSDAPVSRPSFRSSGIIAAAAILALAWIVIGAMIDPRGEFMINDDWAFVRTLETLVSEGRLASTGWGPSFAPGGPALLTHLIWGWLFTHFWGFSLTALRISVLVLGILGSVALLILLRLLKAGAAEALLATLTVVFNPLFLSQSFTYMTDVTFTSMMILSVMFLAIGVEGPRIFVIAIGLVFALLAILTRQLGLAIPAAFVLTLFVHPAGRAIGRWKGLCLTVILVIIPWVAYEYYLSAIGSTPISRHLVLQEIFLNPITKGFPDYFKFLFGNLFSCGLMYIGLFILPVLALKYRPLLSWAPFRRFLLIFTGMFVIFEVALISGILNAAAAFCPNVIFDFGIGPVLLKDVYIMGEQRAWTLPPAVYYPIVYWAAVAVAGFLSLAFWSLARLLKGLTSREGPEIAFLPSLCLIAGLLYLGVIVLSGFQDRYLIAPCVLFIIWLVSDRESSVQPVFTPPAVILAAASLVCLTYFSVTGVHDFMELKRAQKKAVDYLVQEKDVNPCHIDAGFEFNGYHCYDPNFQPVKGLSWWWVHKEDYLLTLGSLSGYETVRTFSFRRYAGPPGAIYVLKPLRQDGR
jgi:hypothetical protein